MAMSADGGAAGDRVGPYRITEPLQVFPYATVHRAQRESDDRTVLLWRFQDPYATAAGFVEALEQLAGDSRTRSVPGLVTVEEVGTVQETEPLAFVVTGDAPGGFLVPALEERRAPGVFATAIALGAILDATHQLGLVHGDVQPRTVVLDASGRPALIGLAIRTVVARVSPDADRSPSAAAFRPPERPLDTEADAAADRYGLAALVFYLLCGHSPTEGDELVPPSRWRAGVPARVDEVVMRALSRRPADRFPTASLFTAALTGSAVPAPAPAPAAPGPGGDAAVLVEESEGRGAAVGAPPTVPRVDSGSVLPRAPAPPPTTAVPIAPPPPSAPPPPRPSAAVGVPSPFGDPSEPAGERRGRSIWLAVGIALVVGVVAAAAAVIYLLAHGVPHGVR